MLKTFSFIAFFSSLISTLGAAVTYSSAGSVYSQNFNSLASAGTGLTWVNDSTLPNWYWAVSNTPPTDYYAPGTYGTSDGSGPLQNVPISLGTSGSTDRALGGQNGNIGGQLIAYGLALKNQTGASLHGFNLSYAGEQWRAISQNLYGVGNLQLQYQVVAAGSGSIQLASGWTTVSHLAYHANFVPDSNARVDGNQAAYRSVISGSVGGLTWNADQELWLRWVDNNAAPDNANNATLSMIGIDDVSFSAYAVPEPTRGWLLGAAALCLLGFPRTRKA